MKKAIITCLNGREAISRVLFNCVERLNDEGLYVDIICVYTEESDKKLIEDSMNKKYLIHHKYADNTTAGHKWNECVRFALSIEGYTHFIFMGDDDVITSEGMRLLFRSARQGIQYCGFKSVYYVEPVLKKAFELEYVFNADRLIGAGRIVSRHALELSSVSASVEFKREYVRLGVHMNKGQQITMPYVSALYLAQYGYVKILDKTDSLFPENARRSLDHHSELQFVYSGFVPIYASAQTHIMDFKSEANIWSYSILEESHTTGAVKKSITYDAAINNMKLSQKELNYINTIK